MTVARRVVQVEVERSEAEVAADVLWQAGPSAVSEADLADGRVRLTADVSGPLGALPPSSVVTELDLDGDDHLDAWRAWATPVRAGRGIVLHPAWLPLAPAGDGPARADVTILLDPGRAFGSGSHPTTRLVLAVVEEELAAGACVLDVGAGSGVLSVAAALLGAARVVALDIEAAAVEATRANAAANGVAGLVDASDRPLAGVDGRFDLVLANIGVRAITELAPDLEARVAAGGALVLSGLLVDQVDSVVARFPGLSEEARRHEDGWAASVLRAPA